MKTKLHKAFLHRYGSVVLVMLLLGTGFCIQAKATENNKTVQVDTLWGANNPTPDSVLFNIYSRPDIIKTYGKAGDNPTLDWSALAAEQKAAYFKAVMDSFIQLYPDDIQVENGDSVLKIDNEPAFFYTDLANYVMEGENNIEADTASSLNKYPDIKKITIDNNGYFNMPCLYIVGTSGDGVAHSVSGVFLKDSITRHTTLENDFQLRDSRTNLSALPGTAFMAKTGTVTVSWQGYTGGQFTDRKLMTFNFDAQGKSYLTYINPQLFVVNPEKIVMQNQGNDTTINYQVTWKDSLAPSRVSVNLDTSQTIHTDNGTDQVDVCLILRDSVYYTNKTPLMSGEAGDYNFTVDRINTVKLLQRGVVTNAQYPNGKTYLTTLKQNTSTQHVTVRDMEPPTGDLKRTYLTVLEYAAKLDSALAQIKNVHDNSNGTITNTVGMVYDIPPTTIFMFSLSDATGNFKTLGRVTVDLSPEGMHDIEAPVDKYGITNLWPNPVQSGKKITLLYRSRTPGPTHIEVVTLSGQVVFSYSTTLSQQSEEIVVPLPPLPAGTYLLKSKGQVVKVVVK